MGPINPITPFVEIQALYYMSVHGVEPKYSARDIDFGVRGSKTTEAPCIGIDAKT